MTYLARIMYRSPETLFWIRFNVYREGYLLIEADSDKQALDKMKEAQTKNSTIVSWSIIKGI